MSRENDSTINVNNGESLVYKNATVTFTINAASEADCKQMLQLIRDKVAELDQQCQENYEDYEMTPVNDSVNLVASSDYLEQAEIQYGSVEHIPEYMTNLESSFTEEELVYYNRVYLSRDYEQKKSRRKRSLQEKQQ